MNILFIGPLPDPITGQSLACQVLVRELAKHHHVEVINLSKGGFRQGVNSAARVFAVLAIVSDIWRRQRTADAIYLTGSESFAGNSKDLLIYAACFGRLARMVIHLHGGASMRKIMLGAWHPLRCPNRFFLRRLGGVIVLGSRHVDIFSGVVPDEKIHVVPNFAEDFLFADPDGIERKFSTSTPLRVLFLSNLLPGKGHVELIDAFFALDQESRESIVIDIAGGFESARDEAAFLGRIAGVPQIRYHGTVGGERKRHLFQAAHVFCLPTYYAYEGQPISILEAYAAGCAVITTDHSGVFDVFTPEVNGFTVARRSSVDLAAALQRARLDPGALRAIAARNLQTARLRYRASKYNAAVGQIIGALARSS